MLKVKISRFIKNNINKINNVLAKLIIVAMIIVIGAMIFSTSTNNKDYDQNKGLETYRPQETIIKGTNISDKQYKQDTNLVDQFLEYCNSGEVENAYNLLHEECRKNAYPTLDIFKNVYYNSVFSQRRQYNLQAWISTNKYTVYKIRYVTDILSTGEYINTNVQQDYITLIKDREVDRISIGKYIQSEKIGIQTITNEVEAIVIKKNIFLESEEYEIQIKNKTLNTIMLDSLQTGETIKLLGEENGVYTPFINKIFNNDMILEPGETKVIKISFNKPCSSVNKLNYIEFYKIIRNYNEYINDKINYKDTFSLKIDL